MTVLKRVLITGAGGRIGKEVSRNLLDQWRFQLRLGYFGDAKGLASFQAGLGEKQSQPPEILKLDIRDQSSILEACDGMEAVLHLAAMPAVDTPWEPVLETNIIGTYNTLEAARRKGVKRVVFVSSNHAAGMHENELLARFDELGTPRLPEDELVTPEMPNRPDSLYGVSKSFGEDLGRYYAEEFGIQFIGLRIGTFMTKLKSKRHLSTWISPRDFCHLAEQALVVPDIDFAVVYATSENQRKIWSLASARRVLKYAPRDRAEDWLEHE